MSKQELTSWFDGRLAPVRTGVYQMLNESTGIMFYAYWTGIWWIGAGHTPEEAEEALRPIFKLWPWRGLAVEPK